MVESFYGYRNRLIMALRFYGDESEDKDEKVFGMAGSLADSRRMGRTPRRLDSKSEAYWH